MSNFLLDHLSGHSLVMYLVPESGDLPEEHAHLDYLWDEDDTWLFDHVDNDEFVFVSGMHPEPLHLPSWRVARMDFGTALLICTAWSDGIDPRDADHRDPDDNMPVGICSIHEM